MRITELQSIPSDVKQFARTNGTSDKAMHLSKYWRDELKAIVSKYNLTALGHGQFAQVYGSNNLNYVIKIFTNGDHAYNKWLEFCFGNQNNPYVPKFKNTKITKISSSLVAVRMEKLQPARFDWDVVDHISTAASYTVDQIENLSSSYINGIEQQFPDFRNDTNLHAIQSFLSTNIGLVDIHEDNIMMRGNTIVFTDPLYSPEWTKF